MGLDRDYASVYGTCARLLGVERRALRPKKLIAARENSGVTQRALARAARIAPRHYQRLEAGDRGPSPASLARLALALWVAPRELLGRPGSYVAPER